MSTGENFEPTSEHQLVLTIVSHKAYLDAISNMRAYLDAIESNLSAQLVEYEKKLSAVHVGDSSVN